MSMHFNPPDQPTGGACNTTSKLLSPNTAEFAFLHLQQAHSTNAAVTMATTHTRNTTEMKGSTITNTTSPVDAGVVVLVVASTKGQEEKRAYVHMLSTSPQCASNQCDTSVCAVAAQYSPSEIHFKPCHSPVARQPLGDYYIGQIP